MQWKHSHSKCWRRNCFHGDVCFRKPSLCWVSQLTHHRLRVTQLPLIYNPATVLVLMAVTLYWIHYWKVLILVKRAHKSRWVVVAVVGESSDPAFTYPWNGFSLCEVPWVSDCPSRESVSSIYPVCIPDHTAVTEGPLCGFGWKNTSWV